MDALREEGDPRSPPVSEPGSWTQSRFGDGCEAPVVLCMKYVHSPSLPFLSKSVGAPLVVIVQW